MQRLGAAAASRALRPQFRGVHGHIFVPVLPKNSGQNSAKYPKESRKMPPPSNFAPVDLSDLLYKHWELPSTKTKDPKRNDD